MGEVQQARISNDGLYPDSERHKAEKYKQCQWEAYAKRDTGKYHFHRFRNMHLLSLCLYEEDIRILEYEIDSMIAAIGSPESRGSREALGQDSKKPSEILEEKISSMRGMLKSYSELSL